LERGARKEPDEARHIRARVGGRRMGILDAQRIGPKRTSTRLMKFVPGPVSIHFRDCRNNVGTSARTARIVKMIVALITMASGNQALGR
jgi:hypothetical protein